MIYLKFLLMISGISGAIIGYVNQQEVGLALGILSIVYGGISLGYEFRKMEKEL